MALALVVDEPCGIIKLFLLVLGAVWRRTPARLSKEERIGEELMWWLFDIIVGVAGIIEIDYRLPPVEAVATALLCLLLNDGVI